MDWKIDGPKAEEKPVRLMLDIKPSEASDILSCLMDERPTYYPYITLGDPWTTPKPSSKQQLIEALRAVKKSGL